jgi:transcriptional regulator with XRE-family HTH domain
MASPGTGIGERLRSIRKRRGMTQRELAQAASVSASLVKRAEQGEYGGMRLETARKLAVALKVPTTALVTDSDREEPDRETLDVWEPVRRALAGLDGQPPEQPTADGVRQAVAAIRPAVALNRFSAIRPALPGLIRDAYALDQDDEPNRQARFVALNMTAWVLTQMRQWDTAMYTLDLAVDAAVDKLDTAEAVKTRVWLLLRQGELAEARDTAIRWADEIEPRLSRATNRELSLWGAFLLNVANAAIRDNRRGEALDALKLARAAGDCIGREVMSDTSTTRLFGPVTATYNRAEVYAIDGKPDKTLAIDASIPASMLPATEITRLRHQLDVASALDQLRRYPEAIAVMQETRANAPEWLPQQRYARDILGRIIERRRTLTPEMRELADAVRLPL